MSHAADVDPLRQSSKPYDLMCTLLREAGIVSSVQSLLGWDQETMMPEKGAPLRAEQMGAMSAMAHRKWTDPKLGEAIGACLEDRAVMGDEAAAANVREAKRDFDRATRLPTELVSEMATTASQAMEAWKHARQASDFKSFAPWLERTVALQRRKAERYGVPKPTLPGETTTLYDALLEEYEPGMTAWRVARVFAPMRERLAPLIAAIASAKQRPSDEISRVKVPLERQMAFNLMVAASVGFDTAGGRLDVSAHPFSETVGPGDVRMTTRYREDHFQEAMYTTLHETGHSLYEQGLPKAQRLGQPLGAYISLGIHESQSRMWENFVGRSRAFWEWCLPVAKRMLGEDLGSFTAEDAFRAANLVKPHFIRVESDEATYNLHILLRFDIERALVEGDLAVRDLPGAWNERMRKDLGLEVPEDRLGCLQDVHWAGGLVGYFPTYSLGNLYAAQFWEQIRNDIPDLDMRHGRGDFGALLGWLRKNIHAHGRRWTAPDLCRRVTGKDLSHEALCRHLERKLRPLYGL